MKTAMVLGGTAPHAELIKRLKGLGFRVILVDYLDAPPARNFADEHIQISTLEYESVLKAAKMCDADIVMSLCVDHANVSATYVSEKLNLPKPFSYDLISSISQKTVMKRKMDYIGIQTSRYVTLNEHDVLSTGNLKYPLIIKPADSNSSNGVTMVNNHHEAKIGAEFAFAKSRSKSVVIEEFIDGREFSAYCFVDSSKAHVLLISERYISMDTEAKYPRCYATVSNPEIGDDLKRQIHSEIQRIADAFSLRNVPLHVQFIIRKDQIFFLEFSPRLGGGFSFTTTLESTGFDLLGAAIDSWIGTPVNVVARTPDKVFAINIVYGNNGVISSVSGADECVKAGLAKGFYFHKLPGTSISISSPSSGRICSFIVKAENFDDAIQKTGSVFLEFDIKDTDGYSMINGLRLGHPRPNRNELKKGMGPQ